MRAESQPVFPGREVEVVGDLEANGAPDRQELASLRTRSPGGFRTDNSQRRTRRIPSGNSLDQGDGDIRYSGLGPRTDRTKRQAPRSDRHSLPQREICVGPRKDYQFSNGHRGIARIRKNAHGRPYAEELARRGYVVLVIDGFY